MKHSVRLSVNQALVVVGECERGETPDPADAKRLKRALRRAGALHGGGGRGIPCWTTIYELARLGLVPPEQADKPLHEGMREMLKRLETVEEDLGDIRADVRAVAEVAGEARAATMKGRLSARRTDATV